jgi:hypothetical protein
MPSGAMASKGDGINHFNGVRFRLVGVGNLQINAYASSGEESNPDILVETAIPYTMTATTKQQPVILLNCKESRLSIEFKVTEFGEYFEVQRLILFMKPLFTSVPGRG